MDFVVKACVVALCALSIAALCIFIRGLRRAVAEGALGTVEAVIARELYGASLVSIVSFAAGAILFIIFCH